MAKPSLSNTLLPRIRIRISTFIFKRPTWFRWRTCFSTDIDPGTGGSIDGMIAAADKILSLTDNHTKIVAGHGPLGNKADVTKSRDMLITSCDRIRKLKSAGKSALESVAEKPFADLDPFWGRGIINADQWIQIVCLTL